jgi:microcystin-dependent protein
MSTICMFAGNFAMRGYALCFGQLMSIAQNTALFSLLGTTYGGDGRSTFGLPDLRGRTLIGQGQGTGGSYYSYGEMTGTENTTMLYENLPMHTHLVNAITGAGSVPTPVGNYFGEVTSGSGPHKQTELFYNAGPANTPLSIESVQKAGGNIPFGIQQPLLCYTALIATTGIFPSRI